MSKIKNGFWDEIELVADVRTALECGRHGLTEASECPDCDGHGCIWNNADPTSGQWAPCHTCGDTRGHP